MPFIERPGAKIFFEYLPCEGAEKALVTLVNGHTRSSGDFRMMARNLNAAGISCVILDNRAAGKSEATAPFKLQEMQDDVLAVWQELNIKKSSLLGISMGGFICEGISLQHPDKVDRLVLVSTASDPKWIKSTGGGWINSGTMVEEKMASYFAPGFVEQNPILFSTMIKQTKQAIAEGRFTEKSNMQRDALKGVTWAGKLSGIKAKTLIVHGSEDQVVDIGAAQELAKEIPDADLNVLPGIGHLILAEAPKVLYQTVIEFLA